MFMVEHGNHWKNNMLDIHMKEDEIELRVCADCDAPLPFTPKDISYFNMSKILCDDCFYLKEKSKKKL